MRQVLYTAVIGILLGWLIACSGGAGSPLADVGSEQATIAAVQATVNNMSAESRQTAAAWMADSSAETTAQTEIPVEIATASISGELDYPAAELPPMRIVAINVETNEFYSVEVKNAVYTIEALPPGSYQVLAYVMEAQGFQAGGAGGYTQAVLCGLTPGCDDHELVLVELEDGEAVDGINLADWEAPDGFFPPDPTR